MPYELMRYGSVQNGLNDKNSDLDLTFIINDFKIDHSVILTDMKEVIKKH